VAGCTPITRTTWETHGPPLAQLVSFAIHPTDPNIVYGGTDDSAGLYKTTDGGANWTLVTQDFPDIAAWTVAISTSDPSHVLTGDIYGHGILRSTDGAATFARANSGLTDMHVTSIVVHPTNSQIVYASTGGHRFPGDGVFKSTDGGLTWTPSGLGGNKVYKLAIDRGTPTTLYAAIHPTVVGSDTVYKSTDSGSTWLPSGLANHYIWDISIDPGATNVLYATTTSVANGLDVVKSIDGGAHWTVFGFPDVGIAYWAVTVSTSSTVYVSSLGIGVVWTSDQGASWFQVGSGLGNDFCFGVAAAPSSPEVLYASSVYAGVYRSSNAGSSWTKASNGLHNAYVHGVQRTAAGVLYAGTWSWLGGFMFSSPDEGHTWTRVNSVENHGISVHSFAVSPSDPTIMYVGDGNEDNHPCAVFKSTDSGVTWNPVSSFTGMQIDNLAVHPTNPQIVYAPIVIKPPSPDQPAIVVHKTTDGGTSWAQVLSAPMPSGLQTITFDENMDLHHGGPVVIDPNAPDTVYVGIFGGVMHSTDAGATWSNIGLTDESVFSLALGPTDSTYLVAGTESGKVFGRAAGGVWQQLDPGWPSALTMTIVFSPVDQNTIFVGRDASDWHPGFHGGLYVTRDGGKSWADVSTGMMTTHITQLVVTADTIYAGTYGSGVYVSQY
jgi:photosystem II stability/assembly factor-like uncharacterized protein